DAVEQGCTLCEVLQCDGTVGYGGSPDENGETTLDALIMDGETHDVGAVAALRRIRSAISVARCVLEHTQHSLLAGSQATDFALMMGFTEENLTTTTSEELFTEWQSNNCQPNFWENVSPDPAESCGPYTPMPWTRKNEQRKKSEFGRLNHDTIGMVAIDSLGRIAAGTSTNGASHKIPGRVGDSPIPGSGAYVDRNVGGSAATGDGDVMMRFMPSLIAVEGMRSGLSPTEASTSALQRIVEYYPSFSGAVVALNLEGEYGAACNNLEHGVFDFTVGSESEGVNLRFVSCLDAEASVAEMTLQDI
ncbi:UNVERIFIED_CONTAM: hypothetical protein GTU68_034450, partial [Idotea baltica]|nr:hypothetical protein [Idotea baltica]